MSDLRLRRAQWGDVAGLMRVKAALPLEGGGRGGFLLGSSEAGYRALIGGAHVLVLERGNEVQGFATSLPDAALQASDFWSRRAAIRFTGLDPASLASRRLGYFDQLAVLPDPRLARWAPVLGFAALTWLIQDGCEHVFATTVTRPVVNPAALTLLRAVGATRVGEIEEVYDGVGRVISTVHHLEVGDSETAERLARHPLAVRLTAAAGRLGWPPPHSPAG